MGRIVAVVNPAGGAAKPIATMLLADTLAARRGRSVLVVDCDPATAVSLLFLTPRLWGDLQTEGRTYAHFLRQADALRRLPDIDDYVLRPASNVTEAAGLALLPGHPDVALFDSYLARDGDAGPRARQLVRRFASALRDQYDVVLVDCPPAFTEQTQAWLAAADGYVIPARPDILALPSLDAVHGLGYGSGDEPAPMARNLGVLVTLKDFGATAHMVWHRRLEQDERNLCFPAAIPFHGALLAAAEWCEHPRGFDQKYPGDLAAIAEAAADTLLERLG